MCFIIACKLYRFCFRHNFLSLRFLLPFGQRQYWQREWSCRNYYFKIDSPSLLYLHPNGDNLMLNKNEIKAMRSWFIYPVLCLLDYSFLHNILSLVNFDLKQNKIFWLARDSNPQPSHKVCLHPNYPPSADASTSQYITSI